MKDQNKTQIVVDALMSGQLTTDDLQRVRSAFNAAWKHASNRQKMQFSVGDRVSWMGRHGHKQGTIVRFLQKNVKIDCGNGDIWHVGPSILKKA